MASVFGCLERRIPGFRVDTGGFTAGFWGQGVYPTTSVLLFGNLPIHMAGDFGRPILYEVDSISRPGLP